MASLNTTGSEPDDLWTSGRLRPGAASAVINGNEVFAVNRAGVLACANAVTGKTQWQLRLKGSFWGSPAVAAGHLYLVSQEGDLQVIHLGEEEGEVVSEYALKETIQASPAIAHDAIFIRSDNHLWKFAN